MRRIAASSLPVVATLAACGGGSSGGGTLTVSGLQGPDEISVITADTGGSSSTATSAGSGGSVAPGAGVADFPAGAAYFSAEQNEYVYDPSMDALRIINEILGMARQTAYAEMVNEGPYLAQIDESLLDTGGGDSGQGGELPEFQLWTARSNRVDNNSVQNVHFWVPDEDASSGETIFAHMAITQGASDANPFGSFGVNFAKADSFANIGSPELFGQLLTLDATGSNIGFSFYEQSGDLGVVPSVGDFASLTQAVVEMTDDESAGTALVRQQSRYDFGSGDSGVVAEDYALAYNDTHVLRQKDVDTPDCLSRTDFDENVWGYTLYHASGNDIGEEVEIDGGFNFVTAGGDYGWMSYWGMWVPDGVSVNDGDVVTKADFGDDSETVETFTVVKAPGRLVRYSRDTLDLSEITGELFEWWDFSGTPTYYQVSYDGTDWFRVAQFNDSTGEWDSITPSAVVLSAGEWLGMWSQALGGSVNFVEGESEITYFSEEIVGGGDEIFANDPSVRFYGFTEMLASEISQVNAESGSIYLGDAGSVGAPHEFLFDESDLTLRHDVNGDGSDIDVVGLVSGIEVTSGPFTWGMRSGPMVTDLTGVTNVWDLWSAEEYYVYETGHNDWNQFQALVDGEGEYAEFDPPMQFSYLHATAADRNDDATYDGKTVLLQYEGAGTLWGIPDEEVDLDGDGNADHFKPQFAIADGTLMGPNGNDYVVKAVDIELSLSDAPGECGALSLAGAAALTLPDGSGFATPTNGDEPLVEGPPAVVAGVVQGAE